MQNPYKKLSQVNPQKENGHRRISNQVYQALIHYPLSGAELRIAMTIIDRSWGFDKLSATISLSQLTDFTNLSRVSVIFAVKSLEAKKVVVVKRGTHGKPNEYLFNKHFDTWEGSMEYFTTLMPQSKPLELKMGSKENHTTEEPASKVNDTTGSKEYFTTLVKKTILEVVKYSPITLASLQQYIQQYITESNIQGPAKPEVLTGLILNEVRAFTFEKLKEKRGYDSPVSGAEAKAITWMLNQGYSVGDIIDCYDKMKKQPFWKEKFLNMQSVRAQIGEIIKVKGGEKKSKGEELAESWKKKK